MARLKQISSRDEVAPESRHHVDAIVGSRGRVSGPFSVLLHSPELAGRTAHLGAYVRFESTLPRPQVELTVLAAAREMDCAYEWGAHAPQAQAAGVRQEAIDVVAGRGSLEGLTAEEALLIGYVRELLRDRRVSDATFAAARELLGDKGIVELTATIGYYGMLACSLNAFQVPPGDGMEVLPDATY